MVTFRDKIRFGFYFIVIVSLLLWMIKILNDIKFELKTNDRKQDHIISILENSSSTSTIGEITTNNH